MLNGHLQPSVTNTLGVGIQTCHTWLQTTINLSYKRCCKHLNMDAPKFENHGQTILIDSTLILPTCPIISHRYLTISHQH